MARLQEFYREKVVPDLVKKFGYKSVMQVPRLTKITLNMGVSEAVADKKVMDHAVGDLTKIAGQKPVVTKSRKAIAGFNGGVGLFGGGVLHGGPGIEWGSLSARCGESDAAFSL